jgi:DNA replication protein DnaC
MNTPMTHEQLLSTLKRLHLHTMATQYAEIARIAEKEKKTFEQYLWQLVLLEAEHRKNQKVKRLLAQANFPLYKTVDVYDFAIRDGINSKQVSRLLQTDWVRMGHNVVFYGSFGVGKSHLANAIGRAQCAMGMRVLFVTVHHLIQQLVEAKQTLTLTTVFKKLDRFDLIICDELGYLAQTQEGADLFFQLISQRSERKSLLITTNLTYSEWDKVFLNPLSTAGAVDRIIHHCETFNIKGPSWRGIEAKKVTKELTASDQPSTQ